MKRTSIIMNKFSSNQSFIKLVLEVGSVKRTVVLFVMFLREIRSTCSVFGIDSWSVKYVSDAYEDQYELTDCNSRGRGNCEEEQCLVRGWCEEI